MNTVWFWLHVNILNFNKAVCASTKIAHHVEPESGCCCFSHLLYRDLKLDSKQPFRLRSMGKAFQDRYRPGRVEFAPIRPSPPSLIDMPASAEIK